MLRSLRRPFPVGRSRLSLLMCCAWMPAWLALPAQAQLLAESPAAEPLRIAWEDRFLTIAGEQLPGDITVHYLEAYCRPGSTDRDWSETVIPHRSRKVAEGPDGHEIRIIDQLQDGVVVRHSIRAFADEVRFRVVASNPTAQPSQAHWAQPCIRVDKFTGTTREDARELVPAYARQCFILLDGQLTRLPTEPWAREARYTPGQVYRPAHVPADDVNPRPVSSLTPSHGLTGCFSADGQRIMAVAWEPYQELFQGVVACMHSDFRIGGLAPGETKEIRGTIYLVPADVDALWARYQRDFPEHFADQE